MALESNSLIVSLTRDFLDCGVVADGLVGDTDSVDDVGRLLVRLLRTGLGLFPSFASNLLGREMGRGMRDLLLIDKDPFLQPVVLVATLVAVEVVRLLFDELPPEPQGQLPEEMCLGEVT